MVPAAAACRCRSAGGLRGMICTEQIRSITAVRHGDIGCTRTDSRRAATGFFAGTSNDMTAHKK
jgi:hypothetical protein